MKLDKLPNLIKLRELLKQHNFANELESVGQRGDTHVRLMLDLDPDQNPVLQKNFDIYNHVKGYADTINISLVNMQSAIAKEIVEITAPLQNKAWYSNCLGISDDTIQRDWSAPDEKDFQDLAPKVIPYVSWRWPVLQIGARHELLIDLLAGAEMYYLADVKQEYIDQAIENFNPLAKATVKQYLIGSYDEINLSQLPAQQFSCIMCWNMFERLTIDMIEDTLYGLKKLLRSGGVITANVVDGDTAIGAKLVAEMTKSYATYELIEQVANRVGLEFITWQHYSTCNVMVQFKMPGTLTSLKNRPSRGIVKHYQ